MAETTMAELGELLLVLREIRDAIRDAKGEAEEMAGEAASPFRCEGCHHCEGCVRCGGCR